MPSPRQKPATSVARLKRGTLKRILGVFDLFSVGYGDLGSSIYYALGVTALFAMGATPIALGLAGLVFVCTALSYAEMTSLFQESGGSASFARYAFNDLISFIAGWGLLLDYIVTIAISAFAVGPYLAFFFADLQQIEVQIVFTIALILGLLVINIVGVQHSTRISRVLTVFTLIVQASIIAIGVSTLLNLEFIAEHIRIGVPNVDWSPSWSQFIKGVAMAMVAYTGIESIAQLAAESQQPVKTVPRAICWTMLVLVLVYLGISVVALSAVSAHDLGTTFLTNPIAAIVSALPYGKEILGPVVALLAAIVLTVAANAGLLGASRLAFNLGENYQLPRPFYLIHSRFRTPMIALICFGLIAITVVVASQGQLDFMADLYNFGAMLAFLSTHLSLLVLRIRRPEMKRPFKSPLNLSIKGYEISLTAVIGALATFGVWCLVVITKPYGRYLGCAWMTLGILMYFYYRKKRRLNPVGSLHIEQIKIPDFQELIIKKILLPTHSEMPVETLQMACEIAKVHNAQITALQVIELSPSLPLDLRLHHRTAVAEATLKRAQAIAHEVGVDIRLELLRSRSLIETLLEASKRRDYDLIIMDARRSSLDPHRRGISHTAEQLLRNAGCRVMVCG